MQQHLERVLREIMVRVRLVSANANLKFLLVFLLLTFYLVFIFTLLFIFV